MGVFAGLAVFIVHGAIYWTTHGDLGRIDYCLYEDAACSTAVATYATGVFAATAFLIAAAAFSNERTPRLTLEYCTKDEQERDPPALELGMDSVEEGFKERSAGASFAGMIPCRVFDVTNVGRAAAVGCAFEIRVVRNTGEDCRVWANIGTIRPSETVHLRLSARPTS